MEHQSWIISNNLHTGYKRPVGTWGTNSTYGTSEQMIHMEHKITCIIKCSLNKLFIRNFLNITAGTWETYGTYGTSEQILHMEH